MRAAEIVDQLVELGVVPGMTLIVHCAFSRVGPIEGGPDALIEALQDALGPDGTLVMPTMADDDDHPFDVADTPCRSMGVVADRFWRRDGVQRTDSPHGFAAVGPHATTITFDQPVEIPHGANSPVGRVCALDGHVLLIGIGHEANTTVHLAEELFGVGYRRPHVAHIRRDGEPVRVRYTEPDHCCEGFAVLDDVLDESSAQLRGRVGHAMARLMRSEDVVRAALGALAADETVFLHPPGHDEECDAAWTSLQRHRVLEQMPSES